MPFILKTLLVKHFCLIFAFFIDKIDSYYLHYFNFETSTKNSANILDYQSDMQKRRIATKIMLSTKFVNHLYSYPQIPGYIALTQTPNTSKIPAKI